MRTGPPGAPRTTGAGGLQKRGRTVIRARAGSWAAALAMAASTFMAAGARAQAPAAGATDTAPLLLVAALHGREVAMRLEGRSATAARTPAARTAATQYALGLDQMSRGHFDSATAAFLAAATASPDVARYRGDLGFAFAAGGHWSDAEDQYRIAVRLQQNNAWYYVSLGATQLAQEHWNQAAASFTLAVAADSGVIIRQLIEPAGDAYERSRNVEALDTWSRMAIARFPDQPTPWLRVASANLRSDTSVGFPAIRRYRTMKPQDLVGAMLYSEYLFLGGRFDSSAVMAEQATADTSLHHLASVILYNVGGHYLTAGQPDSAAQVLIAGRAVADSADFARYDLLIGVAKLKQLQVFYNDAAGKGDCHKAHAADSMLTNVTQLITAGLSADSALANQALRGTTQYRPVIAQFVHQCGGR